MGDQKTGIALFVYNRPSHTRQVLDSLRQNAISHLYIFADGPKDTADERRVAQVRDIIDEIDWCATTVQASESNKGLADSIVAGVNDVLTRHERIVVLEDDCVPAADFFEFMIAMLDHYANEDAVMNISGFSPLSWIPDDYPYDIYFTYRASCWGWATWDRAWSKFCRDPSILKEVRQFRPLKRRVMRAGKDLYPMLVNQVHGEIDSWAVYWAITVALHEGLSVNPISSRIMNIGRDGSGTHYEESGTSTSIAAEAPIRRMSVAANVSCPREPYVDPRINRAFNKSIGSGSVVVQAVKQILKKLRLWNVIQRVRP